MASYDRSIDKISPFRFSSLIDIDFWDLELALALCCMREGGVVSLHAWTPNTFDP
jgi:hypothetical protein